MREEEKRKNEVINKLKIYGNSGTEKDINDRNLHIKIWNSNNVEEIQIILKTKNLLEQTKNTN